MAMSVLLNDAWFRLSREIPSAPIEARLPPSAQAFFGEFASVRGRYCDLVLIRGEVGPSRVDPSMTRLGWDDSSVEVCCRESDETIYRLATDVPRAESLEGQAHSLYHVIVRTAVLLEYLIPPAEPSN